MSDKSYTAAIKKVLKILNMSETKYLGHIGRSIAPGCLEMEEVPGVDKRAIGNWTTDVFGSHYDTKLPLAAMRAMSGYDSRRGKFVHARSAFYGDQSHAHLPNLLFPWVDDALSKIEGKSQHTAYGFLSLIKNLRWVILQDAAVMISKGKREHYVYTKFKDVFDTNAFKDYSKKMIQHLEVREKMDPNKLSTLTETVLPYVNGNLEDVNMAVHKIDGTVNQLSQEVTNMTQEISTDLVGIKEEIKDNASGHITVMKHIFKDELYKNSHIIRDQMKTQIANWNYKQADSLVAQADEILQITNDDGDHDKVDTNKRSIHEISDSPHKHEQYQIPETFDTFQKLLEHYYNDAEPYEKAGGGNKWRRHLTEAEKKVY